MRRVNGTDGGAPQVNLNAWLVHHNSESPYQGYRTIGRRSIETVIPIESQEGRMDIQ